MKPLTSGIIVWLGMAVVIAGSSNGQVTVNHIAFPGMEQDISDISGFMTTGEDMGGMRVTAYFDDILSVSQTVNWNPGGLGSMMGSAIGTGWRLDQTGDTWNSTWRLSPTGANLSLFGLLLEGFLQSDDPVSDRATVFDRTDPFFGTDGSYRGNDLQAQITAGDWTHLRVSYIDEVDNLADATPAQQDTYRAMRIQFGAFDPLDPLPVFDPIAFDSNDELVFFQDTDTVGERIPGDPGEEGTPEPASFALLTMGIAVAGTWRVRRSRSRG